MIIHKPKIRREGEYIYLSSDIEVESDNSLSTNIWYRFPVDQESFVSDRSDAFVVGLVFLAMKLNEDITVEGVMSPKLAYNLKQFQGYFCSIFPNMFHRINIICKNLQEDICNKKYILNTFSGGVDSFYTLLFHTNNNVKIKDKITHSLFVGGFDSKINDEYISDTKEHYEKLLKKIGVKLLKVDTNLKELLDPKLDSRRSYGAVLISACLALNKDISRIYVAANIQYSDSLNIPGSKNVGIGANPLSNPLLSTESTFVFHYDELVSRIEKTVEISKWPLTYNSLRVCWMPKGIKNCSKCSKCLRTMFDLKYSGNLSKYNESFDETALEKNAKKWKMDFITENIYSKDLIKYVISKGRYDYAIEMSYLRIKSKIMKSYDRYKNAILNRLIYHVSHQLKQKYPFYKKLIYFIKKT